MSHAPTPYSAGATPTTTAAQRRADFLAKSPPSARGAMEKAFQGTASPRQAIKAHCLTCASFDRDEIRSCRVILCPLWAYRPFQVAG